MPFTVARLKGGLTCPRLRVSGHAYAYLTDKVLATALEQASLPNCPVSRYREKWPLCLAHTRASRYTAGQNEWD